MKTVSTTLGVIIAGNRCVTESDSPDSSVASARLERVIDDIIAYLINTYPEEYEDLFFRYDPKEQLYYEDVELIIGGARGVDYLAGEIAASKYWSTKIIRADWSIGSHAGYMRNREMYKYQNRYQKKATILFWNGESLGTGHHLRLAKEFGSRLFVYNYKTHKYLKYSEFKEEYDRISKEIDKEYRW